MIRPVLIVFCMLQFCCQPLLLAHQSTGLHQRFNSADLIVVGSLHGGTPITEVSILGSLQPLFPIESSSVHLCSYTVTVDYVIKGEQVITRGPLDFFWYVMSPDCSAPFGAIPIPRKQAVWFLRVDGGRIRAVEDNTGIFSKLRSFQSSLKTELNAWHDPGLVFCYLSLAPGVGLPSGDSYYSAASVAVGPLIDIVGWSGIIRVLSKLYLAGDPETRAALCVIVGEWGQCLGCARQSIASHAIRHPFCAVCKEPWEEEGYSLFERLALSQLDDVEARGVQEQHRKSLKEELSRYSCSSSQKVKELARTLLSKYFGIAEQDIMCIRCEK